MFQVIFCWLLTISKPKLKHMFTCLCKNSHCTAPVHLCAVKCTGRGLWWNLEVMDVIHVCKVTLSIWVNFTLKRFSEHESKKSSFTGEKSLVHLLRDSGFNRRQRVSLQTHLALFAGGKPALVTALMILIDSGDRVNLYATTLGDPCGFVTN